MDEEDGSSLALASIQSQHKAHIPVSAFKFPVGIRPGRRQDVLSAWEEVSKRDVLRVDDEYLGNLGMPAFNANSLPQVDDVGEIETDVNATDSWKVNVVLSHLPSLLRTIDKTLAVSSHFPQSGALALTLSHPVSENRLLAVQNRIRQAQNEKSYLLFDANLPRSSSDGHIMPKSWLWDVYDELAYRLDNECSTDDLEVGSDRTCIYTSNGRILYGMNSLGFFVDTEGNSYTPEDMTLVSTKVTDQYNKRVRDLLQDMYDEGVVFFPDGPPESPIFSRVNERLWKPRDALYPSAVEQLYN